jgi:glutaredoxin-like protein
MAFLEKDVREQVQKSLEDLNKSVNITFFKEESGCQYCGETKQLLTELSELSDKINLKVMDFTENKTDAEKFGVDKTPATVIATDDKDYGIKLYGIPTGYEFSTLLQAVKMISTETVEVPEDMVTQIKKIDKPVHLQVYVTPTCPHCPRAVAAAHIFAYLNDNIKAEMVEASEFPDLSTKYGVRGVPQIIINEKPVQPGALPPQMFLDEINKALA